MLKNEARFNSWKPAGHDGVFDWDFLLPAFHGTKITPMDFDCVIERKGKMLIFETKIPGKEIEQGQQITLTQAWKQGATIFVLAGKSPAEIEGMAEYIQGKRRRDDWVGMKELKPCNYSFVLYRTRCWFCWASGLPVPTRLQWERERKEINAST